MNKVCFLFTFLCLNTSMIMAQENSKDALVFEANFLGDFVRNFRGGIQRGQTSVGLIHLSALFDTENGKLWKGGNFFIHAHRVVGGSPSQELIGDIQVASNIDGYTNRFIYELWYCQKYRNLSILGGLQNLNEVFHVNENAGVYLNSSFGISPSLSLNDAISIFPATTLGGFVRWENKSFSILSGLYNYNHQFASEENFSFKNHNFSGGYYSIIESQYRIFQGEVKLMEFKMGANYRRCSDNHVHHTEECPQNQDLSLYFLSDFSLYSAPSGRKSGLFFQTGYCPDKNCTSPFYLAFGGNITGLFFPSKGDQIGIAFASAKINQYNVTSGTFIPYRKESLVELTYKMMIHKRIGIQPDIQYIFNPAGAEGAKNALVGLFRTEISF